MKIISVLGARPQFIKASPVCTALRKAGHEEILIHTGQHYDDKMSEIFFTELSLPRPHLNLNVGSKSHAEQTAEMLIGIERALIEHKPDYMLVYGDTNSTLAGAIAACKLQIPIAHVEAGLRSFNRSMPEEHNRVITDHCSEILFCPTSTAVKNLHAEGIKYGVHQVGDTMLDAVQSYSEKAEKISPAWKALGLKTKSFYLATIHRPYTTDSKETLGKALSALGSLKHSVIFPVHPRTRARFKEFGLSPAANIQLTEPLGYMDMLALQKNARAVLTDSGGVQKEAFFLRTPCVTLRSETEWVETVEAGWNIVTGIEPNSVIQAIEHFEKSELSKAPDCFGDGHAAEKIVAQFR
jgi:UDP-GlcNAc3NAcA epimerase